MRILTHNAYWLQGFPSRWGAERTAEVQEVVQGLTDLYRSAAADVVCLQEVHSRTLVGAVSQALGMSECLHAEGGRRSVYGGAVLCRFRARLRDCTRAGGHPPHERTHLRARVEGNGGQIELASIHLPSNRYAGSFEAGEAARVTELSWVLAEPPRPTVVVGDMNCLPNSLPYRFLCEAGYVDAAVAVGAPGAAGHRVDYMWLDAAWVGRLAHFAVLDSGAFCRQDEAGNTWQLSDHPPLLMEMA